ncbi:MAG: 4Fe-4S dicluster domain-containing protein [Anaerolineae bacterium]
MVTGWLATVEGDLSGTLVRALRVLLTSGQVDALLVPQATPAGDNVVPTLVAHPDRLERAAPLAPAFPVNGATVAARLTKTLPEGRLGVFLRPCEMRGLVELAKLKQVQMERLFVIGTDCLGAYPVTVYAALAAQGDPSLPLLRAAAEARMAPAEGAAFREACQICDQPVPGQYIAEGAGAPYQPDLAFGLFGAPLPDRVLVTAREASILEVLEAEPGEPPPEREAVIARLVAERTTARDAAFAAMRARLDGLEGLLGVFSTCIRCHNCMVNCPICYCPECIFRTPTFDHLSTQYLDWARRKGALRMPTDTVLFHLTRLNHMATSCVGCGMCTEACPSGISVGTVFRAVGQRVQALFDYLPGRSLEEEVPLATFREEELRTLGEGYLG